MCVFNERPRALSTRRALSYRYCTSSSINKRSSNLFLDFHGRDVCSGVCVLQKWVCMTNPPSKLDGRADTTSKSFPCVRCVLYSTRTMLAHPPSHSRYCHPPFLGLPSVALTILAKNVARILFLSFTPFPNNHDVKFLVHHPYTVTLLQLRGLSFFLAHWVEGGTHTEYEMHFFGTLDARG